MCIYIQIYVYIFSYIHIHMYREIMMTATHICAYMNINMRIHKCIYTHIHTLSLIHWHCLPLLSLSLYPACPLPPTLLNTNTHIHTHEHQQAHTHTYLHKTHMTRVSDTVQGRRQTTTHARQQQRRQLPVPCSQKRAYRCCRGRGGRG